MPQNGLLVYCKAAINLTLLNGRSEDSPSKDTNKHPENGVAPSTPHPNCVTGFIVSPERNQQCDDVDYPKQNIQRHKLFSLKCVGRLTRPSRSFLTLTLLSFSLQRLRCSYIFRVHATPGSRATVRCG